MQIRTDVISEKNEKIPDVGETRQNIYHSKALGKCYPNMQFILILSEGVKIYGHLKINYGHFMSQHVTKPHLFYHNWTV